MFDLWSLASASARQRSPGVPSAGALRNSGQRCAAGTPHGPGTGVPFLRCCAAWAGLVLAASGSAPVQEEGRTSNGLVVLYDFRLAGAELVPNRSSVGDADDADLRVGDPEAVERTAEALRLARPSKLRSRSRPAQISDLVRVSGALSVEAWIEPPSERQSAPGGIVAMSNGSSQHNFALLQHGDRYLARFRTSRTGRDDPPQLSTAPGSARPSLQHVVFTRGRTGRSRLYLDGEIAAQGVIAGSTLDWEKTTLALGNGPKNKQPWLGAYRLLAVYGRALLQEEVARNFRAGPAPLATESSGLSENRALFESKIGTLLATRCLDCHDAAVRQGGLDLTRRETALAGGDRGNAIVPGAAAESLVWLLTQSDAMPQNRAPLAADEKEALRAWIDGGAHWSVDALDTAVHGRGRRDPAHWIRRLTAAEYVAAVRSATGVDITAEATGLLPPDFRADGFENTAYNLTVDMGHVEAFARLAGIVAGRVDIARVAGEGAALDESRIRAIARRLLRGPPTEFEIGLFRALADSIAAAGGTYEESARQVVEAMLQSPRFLYLVEQQVGDGTPWPVGAHELAARTSFIVWGEPPDAALSAAADAGTLHHPEELRRQARRMLADPRAAARSADFVAQWLDLGRLENLRPDRAHFPQWNEQLAADMRAETAAFFRDVAWTEKRPLADLLDAQFTYLTPGLAAHYGLEPRGPGLRRYELAGVPSRGGILTQGAVLTKGGSEASMVTRGLFVLEDLLFGKVGAPPPGLDTTPVPASPGRSRRAIAMDRVASPSCGGCHAKFEPLAFGLERFDGLGAYREVDEHGNALREDGEILFPGSAEPVAYATTSAMMELLAKSDRVRRNLTRKMTQFAIGRPLVAGDQPALDDVHRRSQAAGGTYQSLIEAIVTSDLVRKTQTELQAGGYD